MLQAVFQHPPFDLQSLNPRFLTTSNYNTVTWDAPESLSELSYLFSHPIYPTDLLQ